MERNFSSTKKKAMKRARAAHSNISALNALRESIEWNEKLRDEKKKKQAQENLNDPNWQRKHTFSDSSNFDNSNQISEELSSSSSSSSSMSEENEPKSVQENNPKYIKALASNGEVDRVNDELKTNHSKIAKIMKSQI